MILNERLSEGKSLSCFYIGIKKCKNLKSSGKAGYLSFVMMVTANSNHPNPVAVLPYPTCLYHLTHPLPGSGQQNLDQKLVLHVLCTSLQMGPIFHHVRWVLKDVSTLFMI